jgi:hypothetical protein
MPRQSRELTDNLDQYERFLNSWQPVFDWQNETVRFQLHPSSSRYHGCSQNIQMKHYHEEIYEEISPWIQKLPLNSNPPADPWSGIVINANCATRAHRDIGDDSHCMVLAVTDCTGGDLVFHELGLVFPCRNGDASVFCSVSLTHYNLDFHGTRGSLVFHSDKAGQRWKKDANGWQDNRHFS